MRHNDSEAYSSALRDYVVNHSRQGDVGASWAELSSWLLSTNYGAQVARYEST